MRASRLVNLLLLLQTRGQLTAAELAAELEVSERTIHRDVEALAAAGVPIYAERGPHGGFRLVEGYRTRLTGLTTEEAEALFLSGLPGPAAELGLGTVVAAARLKVLAALPTELRSRASRILARFHLDAPSWFRRPDDVPYLAALAEAVWEDRRLRIGYQRPDRVVERLVDPLGLVLKGGVWYLVARVEGGQIRTYRVSRVVAVEPTGESFERPEGFDLADHWARSIAAYEQAADRVRVTFDVEPQAVERVRGYLSDWATLEPTQEAGAGARIRLSATFDWLDEAELAAFRLARVAEVVDPPEIRQRIVALAEAALARYRSSEPGGGEVVAARPMRR